MDAAAEEMGGARSFFTAQMKAIVGIEIPIERIEGKWKLSQNRAEADRAGVIPLAKNHAARVGNNTAACLRRHARHNVAFHPATPT